MAATNDIVATAGLDLSSFDTQVAKMDSSLNRIEASAGKTDKALKTAGGGFKNFGFVAGNVANQAQDIAVQLQSGAKGATVLAQQGSQILSAFGPTGAIAGGVLAIGAGIYSWVTGMKDAQKQAEQMEAALRKSQQAAHELNVSIRGDRDAADIMEIARTQGEANAQVFEKQLEYKKRLQEIEDKATTGSATKAQTQLAQDEAKRLFDEQVKGIRDREDKERREKKATADAAIAASKQQIAELDAQIEGETDLQKIMRLRKEITEAISKNAGLDRIKSGTALPEDYKFAEEIGRKQLEIQNLQNKATQEGEKNLKKYGDTLSNDVKQGWKDIVSTMKGVEQIAGRITKEAKDQVQEAKKLKKAQDDYINDAVKKQRMTPQEKSAAAKEGRANNRAIRQIDARESEQARNSALNRRQRVPDAKTRTTEQARAAIVSRNAPKINSMIVDNLTVTTIANK